jgi:hypothetical protein
MPCGMGLLCIFSAATLARAARPKCNVVNSGSEFGFSRASSPNQTCADPFLVHRIIFHYSGEHIKRFLF